MDRQRIPRIAVTCPRQSDRQFRSRRGVTKPLKETLTEPRPVCNLSMVHIRLNSRPLPAEKLSLSA